MGLLSSDAGLSGQSASGKVNSILIGDSNAMTAVRDAALEVARRRTTVMVLGPTGSGKEVVARFIHAESDRAHRPFIPVDCTALADGLFESEMFGHVRGAFSGAVRDTLGLVRAADGGTLFLDELGELSLAMQAKLLRVIQERQISPVGSIHSHSVDIRIICATHRDLTKMVRDKTFREDLYYRLNVVVLNASPLAARLEDVPALAEHFLRTQADVYAESFKRLTAAARDALTQYAWPGNVRELANAMEHAHVFSKTDTIELKDLPPRVTFTPLSPSNIDRDLHMPTVERQTIAEALRRCQNNKAAASRMLGMNIQKLNRRMRALGVEDFC